MPVYLVVDQILFYRVCYSFDLAIEKVTQMTEIGNRAIDNNNDDNFKCIWDRSLEVIED